VAQNQYVLKVPEPLSVSAFRFHAAYKNQILARKSLVRFGPPGRENPGIIDADWKIRDLSKIVPDIGGDVLSVPTANQIRTY
jgi:hypothetical protein